ncbi:plasma membrane ascorbate-dependent reductase CYBRD1 isoform X2 [Strix aluco]|uniref:plasma membrane ascorbate-dependent reductase CYBRD1 isoform X2 n=2 Tax=Strix aluco TaxID=111821 RepID=UPI003DA5489F
MQKILLFLSKEDPLETYSINPENLSSTSGHSFQWNMLFASHVCSLARSSAGAQLVRAIIVYRLPWTWKCSKLLMKFIHAGLNTIAMILAIVSMVAVFEYHNARNIPNMYSLHSWIGLTAVIFYSLQLFLGFAVFLLPFAPVPLRAALLPIHVYSGLTIFATVIATALMGITEKLIFSLKSPAYSASPPEATFVNCLGLLLVVFGALILWMASRPHWKRPPEENAKVLRPIGETPEGTEAESTMTDGTNADKSDMRINSEAARKQNLKLDEAGQRSTM